MLPRRHHYRVMRSGRSQSYVLNKINKINPTLVFLFCHYRSLKYVCKGTRYIHRVTINSDLIESRRLQAQ